MRLGLFVLMQGLDKLLTPNLAFLQVFYTIQS